MIHLIEDLAGDWRQLDDRIETLTRDITVLARQDAGCRRLMGIPGVGLITASAMVAAIGTGAAFAKGRDFAAWLGLVPKQISTGDRTILGGLSKRGNRALRTLFVGGAQVLLQRPHHWQGHRFGRWLLTAAPRLHRNVLARGWPTSSPALPGACCIAKVAMMRSMPPARPERTAISDIPTREFYSDAVS